MSQSTFHTVLGLTAALFTLAPCGAQNPLPGTIDEVEFDIDGDWNSDDNADWFVRVQFEGVDLATGSWAVPMFEAFLDPVEHANYFATYGPNGERDFLLVPNPTSLLTKGFPASYSQHEHVGVSWPTFEAEVIDLWYLDNLADKSRPSSLAVPFLRNHLQMPYAPTDYWSATTRQKHGTTDDYDDYINLDAWLQWSIFQQFKKLDPSLDENIFFDSDEYSAIRVARPYFVVQAAYTRGAYVSIPNYPTQLYDPTDPTIPPPQLPTWPPHAPGIGLGLSKQITSLGNTRVLPKDPIYSFPTGTATAGQPYTRAFGGWVPGMSVVTHRVVAGGGTITATLPVERAGFGLVQVTFPTPGVWVAKRFFSAFTDTGLLPLEDRWYITAQ